MVSEKELRARKKRRDRVIMTISEIAIAGIIGLAVYEYAGLGIPCLFRTVTGFKCPGCGITHAIMALLRGNVAEAMQHNPVVVPLIPILGLYAGWRTYAYVKDGRTGFYRAEILFLIIILCILMVFWVVRNLEKIQPILNEWEEMAQR